MSYGVGDPRSRPSRSCCSSLLRVRRLQPRPTTARHRPAEPAQRGGRRRTAGSGTPRTTRGCCTTAPPTGPVSPRRSRAPGDLELSAVSERDGTVWYAVTGARPHRRPAARARPRRRRPNDRHRRQRPLRARAPRPTPTTASATASATCPAGCAAQAAAGRPRVVPRAGPRPTRSPRCPAHGAVYVADAAANAVTAVVGRHADHRRGAPAGAHHHDPRVRRGRTTSPTAPSAATTGPRRCPTDVEEGPDASLYVTSLPGGPGELHGAPAGQLLRVLILTGQVTVRRRRARQPGRGRGRPTPGTST